MKAQDFTLVGFLLIVAAALLQSVPLALFGAAWWAVLAAVQLQSLKVTGKANGVVAIEESLVVVGEAAKIDVLAGGSLKAVGGWLRLQVPLMGPGLSSTLKDVVGFGSLSVNPAERAMPLRTTRPGVYVVGPATVSVTDILGLRSSESELDEAGVVVAYPKPRACDLRLPTPADGFGERLRLRRTAPDGKLLVGSRPYQRGDSPRSIHWRLTGHAGSLMTKQLEATADPRIWVLQGASGENIDLDLEVATSLLHHLVSDSFEVGMVAPGACHPMVKLAEIRRFAQATAVQPLRGASHFEPLVKALVASTVPAVAQPPDAETLALFQRGDIALIVGHRASLVWLGYVESLRKRGVVVAWIERLASEGAPIDFGPGVIRGLSHLTEGEVHIEFAR